MADRLQYVLYMKTLLLLILAVSTFTSIHANAATGIIVVRNPNGKNTFSVYERQDDASAVTTYIEIVEAPTVSSIPTVGGVLRDTIFEVAPDGDLKERGLLQVNQMSTLETLADASDSKGSGLVLRKSGSVIFQDSGTEYARIIRVIKEIKARVQEGDTILVGLPEELQKIVDGASARGSRVILIFRQEKKGLNAVNVKLA